MKTRKTSRILAMVLGGGMLLSAVNAEAAFRWPWEKRTEDKRPAPTAPVPQKDPTTVNAPAKPQHEDAGILQKLHEMNLEQVEMSQIAVTRANDPRVKQFAQTMLTDHREADRVIRERAKTLAVTLREERKHDAVPEIRRQLGRMPGKAKADVPADLERSKGADELTDLKGPTFDVTYLERSMELYDLIRAEFNAFKTSESGEFRQQLSTQFDKLVAHRSQAKKLHDEIRNENRKVIESERQDVKGVK